MRRFFSCPSNLNPSRRAIYKSTTHPTLLTFMNCLQFSGLVLIVRWVGPNLPDLHKTPIQENTLTETLDILFVCPNVIDLIRKHSSARSFGEWYPCPLPVSNSLRPLRRFSLIISILWHYCYIITLLHHARLIRLINFHHCKVVSVLEKKKVEADEKERKVFIDNWHFLRKKVLLINSHFHSRFSYHGALWW